MELLLVKKGFLGSSLMSLCLFRFSVYDSRILLPSWCHSFINHGIFHLRSFELLAFILKCASA